jgi:serine protease Do
MGSGDRKRLLIVECIVAAMSTGCMARTASAPAQSGSPSASAASLAYGGAPAIAMDFSGLVSKEGPAVVNISATGARPAVSLKPLWPPAGSAQGPSIEFFRQLWSGFGALNAGPSRSLGSGFIISPNGYILTASKVIAGAAQVKVTLTDRRDFNATVVGNDPASGVALLKIRATNLPTVRIGSPSSERAGKWVVSIGCPYGLHNTATAGIISNMSRALPRESYIPLIQTDMSENAGDAGSPVFNLDGEVIGIETPVDDALTNADGFAFAIPIDEAMKVEQQLQQQHRVEHGRLGITIQEVSGPLAQSFGLTKPGGALVSSVEPDGPSAKAGLRAGDIILQMNGAPVTDLAQLPAAVAALKPGTTVHLVYWRDNAAHNATVVLGRLNEAAPEATPFTQTGAPDGLTVRGLTAEERREAGVKSGVRVEKSMGPAAFAGIEPGDIILMVGNTPVSNPAQFRQQVGKNGNAVALLVQRNGERMFVTLDMS